MKLLIGFKGRIALIFRLLLTRQKSPSTGVFTLIKAETRIESSVELYNSEKWNQPKFRQLSSVRPNLGGCFDFQTKTNCAPATGFEFSGINDRLNGTE